WANYLVPSSTGVTSLVLARARDPCSLLSPPFAFLGLVPRVVSLVAHALSGLLGLHLLLFVLLLELLLPLRQLFSTRPEGLYRGPHPLDLRLQPLHLGGHSLIV